MWTIFKVFIECVTILLLFYVFGLVSCRILPPWPGIKPVPSAIEGTRLPQWVSEIVQSCPTLVSPWTIAYQAPLSMGFSRQGYYSGLPFPSPGDLPNPGIEPGCPALQADALTSEPPGKPQTAGEIPKKWFFLIVDLFNQNINKNYLLDYSICKYLLSFS